MSARSMRPRYIFCIVIDAMRNYYTDQDERGRQPVLDIQNPIHYTSIGGLVVTAPSSLMSAVTMISGKPAYGQYQDYLNVDFQKSPEPLVTEYAQAQGWETIGLFSAREMRNKLRGQFNPIKKENIIDYEKFGKERWSNEFLTNQAIAEIKDSLSNQKNKFYMIWYNSREDLNTSKHVEKLLDYLQTLNIYNSALITITGDHGYPDLSRGLTSDGPDLKKAGLRHDLIMTDDNIVVPLVFKYPNFSSSKYKTQTLDQSILPDIYSSYIKGHNADKLEDILVSKKLSDSNISLSDSRFFLQNNRVTSVRSQSHKLIIDHSKGEIKCFDLKSDPGETNPIKYLENKNNVYNNMLDHYNNYEMALTEEWIERTRAMFSESLKRDKAMNDKFSRHTSIYIEGTITNTHKQILEKMFKRLGHRINSKEGSLKLVLIDDIRSRNSVKEVMKYLTEDYLLMDSVFNRYTKTNLLASNLYKRFRESYQRLMWRTALMNRKRDVFREWIKLIGIKR